MAAEGQPRRGRGAAPGRDPAGRARGRRPPPRPALRRRQRGAADRRRLRARVPRSTCSSASASSTAREVEAALDEAVGDRLVDESPASPGRYSFSHALVRETLQAEVAGRAAGAAAPARSARRSSRSTPTSSTATSASSPTTSSRRRRWARSSARSTTRPARRRRRASGSPTRTRRRSTRRRSTRSSWRRSPTASAGSSCCSSSARRRPRRPRSDDARATLETRRGARARARPHRATSPARRSGSACSRSPGVVDEALIELLEEALEAVGDGDSPLRSQLLSGLAQELYWVDPAGRSQRPRARGARDGAPGRRSATSLAAGAGPPPVHRQRRPRADARGGCAESDEMHELGEARCGDRELELRAHVYRLTRPARSSARSAASTPSSPPSSGWRPSCASPSGSGTSRCCGRCGR